MTGLLDKKCERIFLVGGGGGRQFPELYSQVNIGYAVWKHLLQKVVTSLVPNVLRFLTLTKHLGRHKLFSFCQQEVLKSVDSKILQIHQALPKDTLFFVMFGCGDLSLVTRQVVILCNFRYRKSYLSTLKWNLEPVITMFRRHLSCLVAR